MFFNELPNNTSQQLPLIIVGFGFTEAESALFNIIKPIWGALLVLVSAALLYSTDLGVGYTCALSYIPCFVGGIIMVGFAHRASSSTMADLRRFKNSFLRLGRTRLRLLLEHKSRPSNLRTSSVWLGQEQQQLATLRSSALCLPV